MHDFEVECNMRKNKTTTCILLLAAVFIMVLTPFVLFGEEEGTAEPEVKEVKKANGKLPARLTGEFKKILENVAYFFLKVLPVLVLAAIVNIILLKRRLSLPWKLKPMEKLSIGALAESAAEMIFIYWLMFLFAPITGIVLKALNIAIPVETFSGEGLLYVARAVIIIPYAILFGAILKMVLIHLITPLTSENRSEYFVFASVTSLITPVLLVTFILLSRVVFQWELI